MCPRKCTHACTKSTGLPNPFVDLRQIAQLYIHACSGSAHTHKGGPWTLAGVWGTRMLSTTRPFPIPTDVGSCYIFVRSAVLGAWLSKEHVQILAMGMQ